jgi:hypothetical protein
MSSPQDTVFGETRVRGRTVPANNQAFDKAELAEELASAFETEVDGWDEFHRECAKLDEIARRRARIR